MTAIRAFAKTDIGRKRQLNEDSFLCDGELGLYMVCDGMGGHAAGEVASAMAVEVVPRFLRNHQQVIARFAQEPTPESREAAAQLMERAVQKACHEIYKVAERDSSKRGMGTTLVAMLCAGRKAVIGHVGDSRVYLLRNGRAHQLTEDHTIVQEQLKRGLITREQAATSEVRNVITRAVGIQASVAVDTLVTDLLPGDLYLLCSDGLHGYLQDEEVPLLLAVDPQADLPAQLIDLANNRGGKDNITAVVVSVERGEAEESTDVEAKTEMLRRIPLFQHMTYKELLAILGVARGCSYATGQEIIREGETGDELYVLFRGRADVIRQGVAIAQLKAGSHFGEMGLVDHAPRSATIRAIEDTSAISIERENLLKLMRRDSLLAVKLLWSFTQVLSERLRSTNDALAGMKGELERLRATSEAVLPPPPPPDAEAEIRPETPPPFGTGR